MGDVWLWARKLQMPMLGYASVLKYAGLLDVTWTALISGHAILWLVFGFAANQAGYPTRLARAAHARRAAAVARAIN